MSTPEDIVNEILQAEEEQIAKKILETIIIPNIILQRQQKVPSEKMGIPTNVPSSEVFAMNARSESSGGSSNASSGGDGIDCAGTYPVSGYTRSDGKEVGPYMRSCGFPHLADKEKAEKRRQKELEQSVQVDEENDWNSVNVSKLDEDVDKKLIEEYYENRSPYYGYASKDEAKVEEGQIEDNIKQVISKCYDEIEKVKKTLDDVSDKYEGLDRMEAAQKFASKLPISRTEAEYYSIASKLADGEIQNPKVREQNDFYKIKDIKDENLKQIFLDKAAQMYKIDVITEKDRKRLEEVDVVIPKDNARIYSQIKESKTMQKWIVEHYDEIKTGKLENKKVSINFNDNLSLFATLHLADMHNARINDDGSFSAILNDGYDFDKMKYENLNESKNLKEKVSKAKKNALARVNNNAYEQQEKGKIKRYILTKVIHYSKEDLEKLLIDLY